MGKIKEYILELSEIVDQLYADGVEERELDGYMEEELDSDKFAFYLENKDFIIAIAEEMSNVISDDNNDDEDEAWVDPAGGTHYPGEDPAAMYESKDEIIMTHINEFETGLPMMDIVTVAALGVGLIAFMSRGKAEYVQGKMQWKQYLTTMFDFLPPVKKKRIQNDIIKGIDDFAKKEIDINQLKEILVQNPKLKITIDKILSGDNLAYNDLYTRLKTILHTWTIQNTPIKNIKDELYKQRP